MSTREKKKGTEASGTRGLAGQLIRCCKRAFSVPISAGEKALNKPADSPTLTTLSCRDFIPITAACKQVPPSSQSEERKESEKGEKQ